MIFGDRQMIRFDLSANDVTTSFLEVGGEFELRLINTVEECKQRIIFSMRDRIIFVIVTLRAANG